MESKIKHIIYDTLKIYSVERIILFGSRARKIDSKYNDYDLYVILNKVLDRETKIRLTDLILNKLAVEGICADLILSTMKDFNYYKQFSDTVTHFADLEGIEL